jgi:hypothetical protein
MPASRHPPISASDKIAGALNAHLPRFMRWLGDLETRVLAGELPALRIERPVYVCGLARSGTTLLLEALAAAPDFTTHRYSDYPLLWIPYWWNWLRARLPLPVQTPVERAHRDRVTVTANSPEAFEEVFWMRFFPGRHDVAVDQILDSTCDNPAFANFYTAHIHKLLAVRGARRYLAKGNYNLTRIGYLRRLFPDARFVIAVREPYAHVASLVKQDGLFSTWARSDPAIATHLARSGHFEFGPHKRAVNVGDAEQAAAIQACYASGRAVEGYARQWASSYGWLLQALAADDDLASSCHWVGYEHLCSDPARSLRQVYTHAGLDADTAAKLIEDRVGRIAAPDYYVPGIDAAGEKMISAVAGEVWRELVKKV